MEAAVKLVKKREMLGALQKTKHLPEKCPIHWEIAPRKQVHHNLDTKCLLTSVVYFKSPQWILQEGRKWSTIPRQEVIIPPCLSSGHLQMLVRKWTTQEEVISPSHLYSSRGCQRLDQLQQLFLPGSLSVQFRRQQGESTRLHHLCRPKFLAFVPRMRPQWARPH